MALPAVVIGASFLRLDVERLRRLAVASAWRCCWRRSSSPVSPRLRTSRSAPPRSVGSRRRGHHSHRHALGRPPAVRGRPVAAHGRGDAARGARSGRIAPDGARHAHHAGLLSDRERGRAAALSVASVWTFLSALADPAHQHQRRIVAVYLGFSTLLFASASRCSSAPGVQNTAIETAGMWLIVIAALVRKGIVPFHAWVPEVFDHGRLGPAIPVQRAAGGRLHDRGADRAARLARHAAGDRHPGARDRGLRCGARARPDQRAPGVRLPVHESVRAGDGGPRLHERERAGGRDCWCGCRPGWRLPDSPAASSSSRRAAGGSI